MRKKTISCFFDILFWALVYGLPIIVLIISAYNKDIVSFSSVLSSIGVDCTDNIVYTTLVGVFGTGGSFPMFANNSIFEFATYFILANILHLVVDVLVFIPRLCHEFMDKPFGGIGR